MFSPKIFFGNQLYRGHPSLITRTLKSELNITWKRPEKINPYSPEQSGDRAQYTEIDQSKISLDFQKSKELIDAPEIVKNQYSLGFLNARFTNLYFRNELVTVVRRHEHDYGSMEAKLGEMTARIRFLQSTHDTTPHNGQRRKFLKELIDKRNKYLRHLRRWDYKKYEWILEKLDLEYKNAPQERVPIARKIALRLLTSGHCENLKQQRLTEYRKALEREQLPYLEDKIKKLEFIKSEEEELGLPATVTQEQIDATRKQYEELKAVRAHDVVDDGKKKWSPY